MSDGDYDGFIGVQRRLSRGMKYPGFNLLVSVPKFMIGCFQVLSGCKDIVCGCVKSIIQEDPRQAESQVSYGFVAAGIGSVSITYSLINVLTFGCVGVFVEHFLSTVPR